MSSHAVVERFAAPCEPGIFGSEQELRAINIIRISRVFFIFAVILIPFL